jgi:predicted dienelactone hydrolase
MRILLLGLVGLLASATVSLAEDAPYHAGFLALEVEAEAPFAVGVWYPARADETTWRTGFYAITAARDAQPAPGRFPLILLSHGSGADEFHHRDWARTLARHGFIVAAIRHAGDSLNDVGGRGSDIQLTGRPWQVEEALNTVLADPRLKPSIDAERIGMIGYSAGGYTTMTMIGGRPNYALWGEHCKAHPEDDELCPTDASWVPPRITRPGWALPPPDPRIKAAVVMAPAGILFDAQGLSGVSVPVRLYRAADDSHVRNQWNADNIAALLPAKPEIVTVPGDHFIFIAPCPNELAQKFPESCNDAEGIDRTAIHDQIGADLVAFFTRTLGSSKPAAP